MEATSAKFGPSFFSIKTGKIGRSGRNGDAAPLVPPAPPRDKGPEIIDRAYRDTITWNARNYAALRSAYSGHKAIAESDRVLFLREIVDAVVRCSGKLTLDDAFLLSTGKNPR